MLFATLKKVLTIFATDIENVNSVIYNEARNDTKRIKINYQISERYIKKEIEMCYLQSLN